MRKFVLIACLLLTAAAHAQYNNEWIDFSKTYYKFKVGQTGLYRINADALNAIGLGNTPAETVSALAQWAGSAGVHFRGFGRIAGRRVY